jgi:hypothetical protein
MVTRRVVDSAMCATGHAIGEERHLTVGHLIVGTRPTSCTRPSRSVISSGDGCTMAITTSFPTDEMVASAFYSIVALSLCI